ncbi:DNA-binding protein [Ignicoccus pacificus DSM 13166]|uniref:Putative HTH-type transcriptional regulatory protein IPA_04215 n=1 Tax=Ignicoccus pacificus DSM 13166 TaxID=940294 RepID=A0A977K9D9_9CREN|nr:DNA-binding protein [Ignicoccus pacificus DSM 13166]
MIGGEADVVLNGRASDAIVRTEGGVLTLLIESNASRLKREKVGILNMLAKCIGGKPLIVSERLSSEELIEDVVYERHGTPVVSPETLIKIIRGEKIFIRKIRSGFVVKVNPRKLREARLRSGMSIGALANYLGVSKKSVYDYETKGSRVSVEIAAKLVELYGEDVLETVDLGEFEGVVVDAEPHSPLEAEMLERSKESIHVPRGNVHVGGEIMSERFVAVLPHGDEDLEWFAELTRMIDKKAAAIGFEDVPKELESSEVVLAEDLETFMELLKKGHED